MANWLGRSPERMAGLQARWLERLQGDWVLPAARHLYLGMAALALAGTAIACVAVLYFQVASLRSGPDVPDPPEQAVELGAFPLGVVDARLEPPTNIRFAPDVGTITTRISESTVLGRFVANSRNGLAEPPDDFVIIGGRDQALFSEDTGPVFELGTGASSRRRGTVLKPTPALVSTVNALLTQVTGVQQRNYALRVIAADALGNRTAPVDLIVTLRFGAALPEGVSRQPPPDEPEVQATPDSPLSRVAKQVAGVVDPQRTDVYFDAFDKAYALPVRCNAEREQSRFVAEYQRAFDHARRRLDAGNIEAFYVGICDAWSQQLGARTEAEQKIKAEWAQAASEAAMQRAGIEASNLINKALRNTAVMVAAGMLLAFLIIALLLAFLAIEGHSKAVREVLAQIATQSVTKQEQGT